ncbi:GNAT family N-acetyltransferase [Leptospira noguchii]|uniref:N-acetyltransferase domain-containing protein n=1 Tax=Leptospira noguchii TaxID=28182 RepID=M6V8I2_9LEPT|nr:hypothetical protein [Leptospira noguchii]EMO53195.1 hypothetical protein LEP1GSC172_4032 [Leptospira noguchii]
MNQIREASMSDLKSIINIMNEYIEDDSPSSNYANRLSISNPPKLLVDKILAKKVILESDGNQVKGYAFIEPFFLDPSNDSFAQVGVYIAKKFRNGFTGPKLLIYLFHIGRKNQVKKLFSFVLEQNSTSIKNVERLFDNIGVFEKAVILNNTFNDVLIFQKDLEEPLDPRAQRFYDSVVKENLSIR